MTSGDWEEGAIGSLFSFHRTVALSRAQLSDNAEIGYIHYGDIHAKWGTHLDLSRESLPRAEARLAASATPVADGDLVLADASEDIEGVGRAVEICGVGQQRVVAGLHTVLLRPRAGVFAPRYGGLLPETPEFRVQARTLAAGLKVYGLSKSSIKQIVVRVPPLKEQEAIAEALVDSDAAIEALDALIAKKRNVKQATMQQLLTGHTRLPGFIEGWKDVNLGEIARMRSGGTPPTSVSAYYGGDTPWASISDMSSSGKYLSRTERTLTDEGLANSAAVVFPAGVLLYAMYASIGECCVSQRPMATSQAILGIECTAKVDVEYLYYVMQNLRPAIAQSGQQGTQSNLNAQMVRDTVIPLPTLQEQHAIAAVLSGMDAEIEALVAQRDKSRLLKQGMMQELLSGRVRLV